jgi:hypothetical protein
MWTAFNVGTWSAGSTLLALGLTVGQAMGAATVSYIIIVVSPKRCLLVQRNAEASDYPIGVVYPGRTSGYEVAPF